MQILVADDDPTYRSLLQDLLTKWHFEVALACDGLEALEIANGENPPQLAILDWEMPGIDGFEVAMTIRDKPSGNNVYVLMITGGRKKQDMMKILVCGADDYLIKPFDPMDLKIHLRSAMRILHLTEDLDELKRTCRDQTARAI